MRAGEASMTARRVAAHRLGFERVETPSGDPAADERLARDVAGSTTVEAATPMVAYLAARTTFFDRVVVGALDRGMGQVVIAAAGYDGRALRYAKPGVRWFEVDHPDTQRDKRERLDRLEIEAGHIAFVAADFSVDPVASALTAAGHEPTEPTLFLCEGVAVYLERAVLESLLAELGHAASPGSRLAISVSVATASAEQLERRARFQTTVAAMGEPARSVLPSDDVEPLFAAAGWRAMEASERARSGGLLVCEPL